MQPHKALVAVAGAEQAGLRPFTGIFVHMYSRNNYTINYYAMYTSPLSRRRTLVEV